MRQWLQYLMYSVLIFIGEENAVQISVGTELVKIMDQVKLDKVIVLEQQSMLKLNWALIWMGFILDC